MCVLVGLAAAGRGGARHLPLALVSSSDPTSPLLQEAVRRLAPVLPILTELGARFADAGHELSLVGGPVRDAFLGRTSPDLDFTTDPPPLGTWALQRPTPQARRRQAGAIAANGAPVAPCELAFL